MRSLAAANRRSPTMNVSKLAIVAVTCAGALAAASVEARGRDDVQLSVTIGQPAYGPAWIARSYYRHDGYRAPTRWDRDGDGIPNRRDPIYNPRWDRDGDGIP